jgi:hypothetical protein
MNEIADLDKVLMHLFSLKDGNSFIMKESLRNIVTGGNSKADRLLIQLGSDGLIVNKERYSIGQITPTEMYSINFTGIWLCSTLPSEFENRPYSYFLKKKWDEQEEQKAIKQQVKDVNQAVIDTNDAIKKTTTWTRLLFWATFVIAIGTISVPLVTYINDTEKGNLKQQVKQKDLLIQQIQTRQPHIKTDSSRPKVATDSSSHK